MKTLGRATGQCVRIGFRKTNDARRVRRLFIPVSRFEPESFPVPLRYFRLAETEGSEMVPGMRRSKCWHNGQSGQRGTASPAATAPALSGDEHPKPPTAYALPADSLRPSRVTETKCPI